MIDVKLPPPPDTYQTCTPPHLQQSGLLVVHKTGWWAIASTIHSASEGGIKRSGCRGKRVKWSKGGGSKFMNKKGPNQLCWLTTTRVHNSKTNKAQASRFCSTASHHSKLKREGEGWCLPQKIVEKG